MKKFNIRKVLDGLKEVSSSTPSVQVGPQENHLIQETLQSEHFQLCKVGETGDFSFSFSIIQLFAYWLLALMIFIAGNVLHLSHLRTRMVQVELHGIIY